MNTISNPVDLIEGYKKVAILLADGTKLSFYDAVRNLLNFKDICLNKFHVKIINENNVEYLYYFSCLRPEAYINEVSHSLF